MNNSDMPANSNSLEISERYETGYYDQVALGLTKREHFAGLALQAVLSNPKFEELIDQSGEVTGAYAIAESAVIMADALLLELDK